MQNNCYYTSSDHLIWWQCEKKENFPRIFVPKIFLAWRWRPFSGLSLRWYPVRNCAQFLFVRIAPTKKLFCLWAKRIWTNSFRPTKSVWASKRESGKTSKNGKRKPKSNKSKKRRSKKTSRVRDFFSCYFDNLIYF